MKLAGQDSQLEQYLAQVGAELAQLHVENEQLRQEVLTAHEQAQAALTVQAALAQELSAALHENATLRARITALEQTRPGFVKPNQPPPQPKAPRKKRDPSHNHGRRRAVPTEVRRVAYEACPDCGYRLRGESIARRREVIDLPPPVPVTVIEFQLLKRYCPHCQCYREPELVLDELVVGHGRFSKRILALIAWLRTSLRLPIKQIQRYLAQLHALTLSVGEIVDVLHLVAELGQEAAAEIKQALRAEPVLYLDETGWREAGQNGYVWVMTDGQARTYFHYDGSRAGAVARGLTGAHYAGTLCSDFYAGYNEHTCRHQRCWAHLLRDLAKLEEAAGHIAAVQGWVEAVCKLYEEGREANGRAPPPSLAQREEIAAGLRGRAHELGLQWAQTKEHPCYVLGKRLLRHEGELFEFVRQEGVGATNNAAERAIRPLAVARKISGGTRSAAGSATRMRLQTLFRTWENQGRDPLATCLALLGGQTPLPSL